MNVLLKVVYTRRGFNGVADGEVAKKLSQDDQIDLFKKVPAFIDVCIDGLIKSFLPASWRNCRRIALASQREATQALTFTSHKLFSLSICAGSEQGVCRAEAGVLQQVGLKVQGHRAWDSKPPPGCEGLPARCRCQGPTQPLHWHH